MNIANLLTGLRIVFSSALLFTPADSALFAAFYILAGLTDIFDGYAARKLNIVTEFGSRLDTAADICFAAVSAYRILPVLSLSLPITVWMVIILFIKAVSVIFGLAVNKALPSVHSILNRLSGILLFIFPLAIPFSDGKALISIEVILCAVCTAAAIHEFRTVISEDFRHKSE